MGDPSPSSGTIDGRARRHFGDGFLKTRFFPLLTWDLGLGTWDLGQPPEHEFFPTDQIERYPDGLEARPCIPRSRVAPVHRKQSGCLALRTNGTTPLKRPRRRRGPRPPAPAPAPSRGARRRPSARRRTARPRARSRAARTGSEEPAPALRGILPHPLGCGASRWRRSRRSGSYQGGIGGGRAAAPAVLQFCFTDAAPAPCAIYDGRFGTASRAEASDRVAEEWLRVAHPRRAIPLEAAAAIDAKPIASLWDLVE